jgi:hypothetical protein
MSKVIEQKKPVTHDTDEKAPRVRGIGNPESHSQDADRHRKIEHPKSEK